MTLITPVVPAPSSAGIAGPHRASVATCQAVPHATSILDLYRSDRNARVYLVLLTLMALVLFGLAIQTLPLWADEGNYGPVAKCILKTGTWLTMHSGPDCDQVLFSKGPLFYWVLAISINLLGASEIALRLPSLLASVGIVALTYHLIFLITKDPARAFFGGVILLTTHQFAFHQRVAIPEPWIILFMLIGIIAYIRALDRPGFLFIVGFCSFFPMLFKQVFPAFLLVCVVIHLLISGRVKLLKNRYLYCGLAAGGLPFLLWNVHQYSTYGAAFLWEYWGLGVLGTGWEMTGIQRPGERVLEFVSTRIPKYYDHAFHWDTRFFYLLWLGLFYHPWLALLPTAVAGVLRAPATQRRAGAFLLVWLVVVPLIVSGMTWRVPIYLLPVYPVLAVLIGGYVNVVGGRNGGRGYRWEAYLLEALVIFKVTQLVYVYSNPGAILPAGWRFEGALTIMSAVALVWWLAAGRFDRPAVVLSGVALWITLGAVYFSLISDPQADMTLSRLRSYVGAQDRPIVLYAREDWLTPMDVNPLWWHFDDLRVCRTPECVRVIAPQRPVVLAAGGVGELDPLQSQDIALRFISKFHFKVELDSQGSPVARRDMYVLEFVRR